MTELLKNAQCLHGTGDPNEKVRLYRGTIKIRRLLYLFSRQKKCLNMVDIFLSSTDKKINL